MKRTQLYIFIFFISIISFIGCGQNSRSIKRMQALEEGVDSPTTIDEIKTAIEKYENRVEDIMIAQQQIGIWYKMLGSRYIDQAYNSRDSTMYGEALKAFQKAIEYYPANPNLYYYIGLCAGYMAKSALDYNAIGSAVQKYNYLKLAESGYLRAIELQPKYARALYGLGVLYVFELDEPSKAIPYLESFVELEKHDTDGMFILARAYYSTYEFDKAVSLYDRIIKVTSSSEKKAEAEANKKIVLDAAYVQQ